MKRADGAVALAILIAGRPSVTCFSLSSGADRRSRGLHFMPARIFKPAKNAMQSGVAKTKIWQLDYEPEQPRVVEPLMGWTSSGDMKQQLTLHFPTREEAVAYCERKGIPYQVLEPKELKTRVKAYADNFAFRRAEPWTH